MKYKLINIETLSASIYDLNSMPAEEIANTLQKILGKSVIVEDGIYCVDDIICSVEKARYILESKGAQFVSEEEMDEVFSYYLLTTKNAEIAIFGSKNQCSVHIAPLKTKIKASGKETMEAGFKGTISKVLNHKGFLNSETNLKIILSLLPLVYKYNSIVPIEKAEEVITTVWNKLQGGDGHSINTLFGN